MATGHTHAVSSSAGSSLGSTAGSFIVNMAVSYLIGRLSAQDGPRLSNLAAAGGEYGVGMPRLYGEKVRATGIFIAQDDILETKHTVEDYSEIVGAVGGAIQGFMIGGPIGAVIGGVVGGLFGAATPNVHYYTYSDTFALLLADRTSDDPIEGLTKLWANGKVIFSGSESAAVSTVLGTDGKLIKRKYGKNRWFKSLTVYGGHTEQGVDPVLSSTLDEDGGYPFTAYVVIEDLQLADFGNSVPPVEVLASVKTGESLASVAEAICDFAGIDPIQDMSSTALNNDLVRGYAVTSETTCWDAIKPLCPVFGFDAADIAGQIRFYKRSQSMRATILPEDMGSYIYGDSSPDKYTFSRTTDLDLPHETGLTFLDPSRDYQTNTATSQRSEGNAKSNITLSIPLVLTATEGASAAALMHWDAWLGRTAVNFTLTDSWNSLEAGLAYAISVADQFVPYRVTRKTRGANGLHEIEALSDESVTYTAIVGGTSGTMPDEESTLFADTRLILLDMSILEDVHDDYGFYVVMGGSQPYWDRAKIQISGDGGATYVTTLDSSLSSVMGDVVGTLAAGTTDGLDDTLDTTSVLTVVLLHDEMELESITDDELDAFGNFAFVGKDGLGEYLQFKTATHITGSTWELTNLRRGRKGTDFAIGTHASGEEFALLGGGGGAGRFRIVMGDTSGWGDALKFRGVTLHQDEADADVVDFTNTGEGKRPYSPVNVTGDWDGSDNLTITWDTRSRMNAGGLGIDDQFNFEVEILNATPVRTITATGVETATYSAANQATDGITPGETVVGRVRQLSDVNNGRWRDFTLVGPNSITFDSTSITMDDTTLTMDAG